MCTIDEKYQKIGDDNSTYQGLNENVSYKAFQVIKQHTVDPVVVIQH